MFQKYNYGTYKLYSSFRISYFWMQQKCIPTTQMNSVAEQMVINTNHKAYCFQTFNRIWYYWWDDNDKLWKVKHYIYFNSTEPKYLNILWFCIMKPEYVIPSNYGLQFSYSDSIIRWKSHVDPVLWFLIVANHNQLAQPGFFIFIQLKLFDLLLHN